MEKVWIGKMVGTHGIKGEIRIQSDFERKDLAFVVGNTLFLHEQPFVITGYRVHQHFDMLTFEGIHDINQILFLKGSHVYMKREDIPLKEGEYLLQDLIGYQVICEKECIGSIRDYTMGMNPLWVIKQNGKQYYIPRNESFIKQVDLVKKQVKVDPMAKELIP